MPSEVMESKTRNPLKKRKLKSKKNKLKKPKNIDMKDFTIVQDVTEKKKAKVDRVLPHWLSHPVFITKNLTFDALNPKRGCHILNKKLLAKLHSNKINNLFPVQQTIIPEILAGANKMETRFLPRDICVATPTGSGKTLSYVLPVIQAIGCRSVPALRVLVLLPVIELAKQVSKVFNTYASVFKLKVSQAFGKESFAKEQLLLRQKIYNVYQCKVDILIATPAGVIEHILNTPGLDFSQIRFLILDEADKLFIGEGGDMIARIQRHIAESKDKIANRGLPIPPFFTFSSRENCSEDKISKNPNSLFFNSVDLKLTSANYSSYIPSLSPPMQRLLFSATLSRDPQHLQNLSLYQPILFTTQSGVKDDVKSSDSFGKVARPAELTEEWLMVDSSLKPLMLHYLLNHERKKVDNFKALVFSNSLELTSKISIILKELSKGKYIVDEFSSKFTNSRKRKLNDFCKGSINVLISSDINARGIDFSNVNCVVSYDVPSANTYVHRIGRTARAGQNGKAITLVTEEDFNTFKKITGAAFSSVCERIIPERKLEKFESKFNLALKVLATTKKKNRHGGPNRIPITFKRKNIKNKS